MFIALCPHKAPRRATRTDESCRKKLYREDTATAGFSCRLNTGKSDRSYVGQTPAHCVDKSGLLHLKFKKKKKHEQRHQDSAFTFNSINIESARLGT